MPDPIRNLLALLRDRSPTVLTLALLGGVAWWGYAWDWKVPSLPELLHRQPGKEEEKEEKEEPGEDGALKPIPLASPEKAEAAGVKVGPVEERMVGEYVTANGEIAFDQNRYAHLSTRAAGTAWRVEKNAGDEVKKGDVLALIASPEVARLKFDLQQTLLLVSTRERVHRQLKSTGTATAGQAVQTAEANLREARIRLFGDEQSLKNLGLTIRAEELTKLGDEEVAARLRTAGIPDSLLQRLDADNLTSNLLPMYAPFDGVVVQRDIVIGETVNPSSPQFVLADLSRLWIMLHVRQEDGRKLAYEQEVAFHLDGPDEDAPPARVKWISPEVDEKTHTIVVRAEVANDTGRLRPRTFGTARILVRRAKRLTVPNGALQFDGKSHLVFVRGESATEFLPVRVRPGPRHDEFTEIESGLEKGQFVAVEGSHVLLSEMLKSRIGGED